MTAFAKTDTAIEAMRRGAFDYLVKPVEFRKLRAMAVQFMVDLCRPNQLGAGPFLRGFYFTSGTQEGRPLDRVLQRMGQVMGVRPPEQQQQQVLESKSYFLHDVFMNVVFRDADVAR